MASAPTLRQLRQDAGMYLSRRLNRSFVPPDWLSVNLTLRCNLHCKMCTTCYPVDNELSKSEILGLIDQAALMGIQIFNPLGGEPFMREDLEEILAYAASRDFYVTLTTNGTLITPERAARLAAIPPEKLHINLSIDGPEAIHDAIRGPGTFERTLTGYRHLREADLHAGNPHRKILCNTLLHDANLELLPGFLDDLAGMDLDGVQILALFRSPTRDRDQPDMWIRPSQTAALERLVEELVERLRAPPHPNFRIQNSEADLRLLPDYHAGRMKPLEAPCWAGWKELYINADGSVILCDGHLDFLGAQFGSIRERTLAELWNSTELRERRRVIKSCRTPCIQNCYLRRGSDAISDLAMEAIALGKERLEASGAGRRLAALRPGRWERIPGGLLTLELTDICDCDWPGCPTPGDRLRELLVQAPSSMEAIYEAPDTWSQWRDRRYVDFGRGFMGQELVRRVVDGLLDDRLAFGTLSLRWRGEPLLHPEIEPILRYLLAQVGPRRPFDRLRIPTAGLLWTEALTEVLQEYADVPVEIWLDLDRMGDRMPPLGDRGRNVALVVHRTVPTEGLSTEVLTADRARWLPYLRDPLRLAGKAPPTGRDAFWLRRADPRSFLGDQAARGALETAAEAMGIRADLPDDSRHSTCTAATQAPTISWDGKVTLCPWDTGLATRIGEVTRDSLATLWRSEEMKTRRQEAASRGRPDLQACRDCHQCFSPNPG